MDLKVNIDPNEVNATISKAIMESIIGSQIKHAVENLLKTVTTGYNNPIQKVIEEAIALVAQEELSKHIPELREKIANHLTDKMVKECLQSFEKFLERRY